MALKELPVDPSVVGALALALAPVEGAAGAELGALVLTSCAPAAPLAGDADLAPAAGWADLALPPPLLLLPALWLLAACAGFFFSLGPALIQPSVAGSCAVAGGDELGAFEDEARQLSEADAFDMMGCRVEWV